MKQILGKLMEGNNLTEAETMEAMNIIMEGNASNAQIGSFLTALKMKGETIEEITGCVKVMRQKAERVEPKAGYCIDTCGTGGDGKETFNISTAVAFVAAAAGVPVAKHGNRSMSSKCGSADVLEALGVNINLSPSQVEQCITETGMGFMFAQLFHRSMKHVAETRRDLGVRTIFNILGPMANPAQARGQVLGVFSRSLLTTMAEVLNNLGVERALVLHGYDGMDEITLGGNTEVCELDGGKIKSYEISPRDFGFKEYGHSSFKGGDAYINAGIIKEVFSSEKGARRDIVLLNAGAALYVGKKTSSIKEGIEISREIIDSGLALKKLYEFAAFTNKLAS